MVVSGIWFAGSALLWPELKRAAVAAAGRSRSSGMSNFLVVPAERLDHIRRAGIDGSGDGWQPRAS